MTPISPKVSDLVNKFQPLKPQSPTPPPRPARPPFKTQAQLINPSTPLPQPLPLQPTSPKKESLVSMDIKQIQEEKLDLKKPVSNEQPTEQPTKPRALTSPSQPKTSLSLSKATSLFKKILSPKPAHVPPATKTPFLQQSSSKILPNHPNARLSVVNGKSVVRYSVVTKTKAEDPVVNLDTPLLKGDWTSNFDDLQVLLHSAIKDAVFKGGTYFIVQERTSSSEAWESCDEYQALIAMQYYQHWCNFVKKQFESPSFSKDTPIKIVCYLEIGKDLIVKPQAKILQECIDKKIGSTELDKYGFIDQEKMKNGLMRVKWPKTGPFKPCYGESSFTSGIYPSCTLEKALELLQKKEAVNPKG